MVGPGSEDENVHRIVCGCRCSSNKKRVFQCISDRFWAIPMLVSSRVSSRLAVDRGNPRAIFCYIFLGPRCAMVKSHGFTHRGCSSPHKNMGIFLPFFAKNPMESHDGAMTILQKNPRCCPYVEDGVCVKKKSTWASPKMQRFSNQAHKKDIKSILHDSPSRFVALQKLCVSGRSMWCDGQIGSAQTRAAP